MPESDSHGCLTLTRREGQIIVITDIATGDEVGRVRLERVSRSNATARLSLIFGRHLRIDRLEVHEQRRTGGAA
jgi:hypothetical protein